MLRKLAYYIVILCVILVSTDINVAHESDVPHSSPYTGASFYYDDDLWTYYASAFGAVHSSASSGEASASAWVETGTPRYHWRNCRGGGSVSAHSESQMISPSQDEPDYYINSSAWCYIQGVYHTDDR